MPKRPATHETVLLVLELLRRIPKDRAIAAAELRAQLTDKAGQPQYNIRTIQRQLQFIVRHFEVEVDQRSKPYGYRWNKNARGFAVPMLSADESLLLHLAATYLQNLLPVGVMKSLQGFFTQAAKNLEPNKIAQAEREWLDKVRIIRETQPLLAPKIKSGVLEKVARALYDNAYLDVTYQNAEGKRGNYSVIPLGLVQQGARLNLACRFHGHADVRTLALHRMQSAVVSSIKFKRPQDFDLDAYTAEGRFVYGQGQRIRLRFKIDAAHGAHLYETPLSEDQQINVQGDWLNITATVVDTGQLYWWLNGFGDAVKDVRKTKVRVARVARDSRSGA